MKVIFVCSGNSKNFSLNPFIKAQADSLVATGNDIEFSPVLGKGLWSYLKHVFVLHKLLKHAGWDIVHAHYSLCGIVASFASLGVLGRNGKKVPVVVSLMGSDVKGVKWVLNVIRLFARKYWNVTIVKSKDMKDKLGLEAPLIIPNGVNIGVFDHLPQAVCRQRLGWNLTGKIILFGADPSRIVKNYALAEAACSMLKAGNCMLKTLGRIPHDQVPLYLNACDVLLLTSKWEGSPNIVKEAMACGIPIVTTQVGDVAWLLEGVSGCFITRTDPQDISVNLDNALQFNAKTNGRERLVKLGLDARDVAKQMIDVYTSVL